ncbi:hypothetical protein KC19_3G085500 [Ceratodon purpureus]|uniref:Uncharacterized protein n=1 Tax=Ceratodon purpureus TaxID=3225 RepID=A0A8T0IG88_CERPU|nr:hypothetical protein KC19_3G085500 [Ceratodon purpureus]
MEIRSPGRCFGSITSSYRGRCSEKKACHQTRTETSWRHMGKAPIRGKMVPARRRGRVYAQVWRWSRSPVQRGRRGEIGGGGPSKRRRKGSGQGRKTRHLSRTCCVRSATTG